MAKAFQGLVLSGFLCKAQRGQEGLGVPRNSPTSPPALVPAPVAGALLTEDVQHRVFPKHDEVPHHHMAHQLLQLGGRAKGVSGMLRLTGALLHGNSRA